MFEFPLYRLAPSSTEVAPVAAAVGEEIPLGGTLPVAGGAFSSELGECFHGYMAVAVPSEDDPTLARALVARWEQRDIVAAEDLVACGARLRDLIAKKWPGAVVETEVPMSFTNAAGQVSEGYIDLLVRTSAGKFVIIDHKVVGGPDVLVHVRHYAGQQDIYRRAVGGDGFADVSVYLHLPHQGKLVEMRWA